MSLFDEIQADILSSASLSTVLRKAKVLAYRLGNSEFKEWIEHELNGYGKEDLPKYRKLAAHSFGDFMNSAWRMSNVPIPTNNISRELRDMMDRVEMAQGAKALESLVESLHNQKEDALQSMWPPIPCTYCMSESMRI